MHLAEIKIENFRLFGTDDKAIVLPLQNGLNVLVGENDTGKTAVIDAIRLTLGSSSQEFFKVEIDDFHVSGEDRVSWFKIQCKFTDIDKEVGGALLEHLSYENGKPCLYVSFQATLNESLNARKRFTVEVRSGQDGTGPQMDWNARSLLQYTYLRPLRDAERELDAGRNSRLSQILLYTKEIVENKGEVFEPANFVKAVLNKQETNFPKSIANISLLADHLVQENEGVKRARDRLDSSYLAKLNLGEEPLGSRVSVTDTARPDQRLRAVLEKLELNLSTASDLVGQLPHGLGYNNLLFMACELLLLGQDTDTLPLLLIEEPEAHLHPQLQLRLVEFLQEQASGKVGRQVQVIITTHSPNLASKVKLASMVLMCRGQAFPLAPEYTRLSAPDYRFLERFLDVTKANLFFARGVLIVEGDAEALLLPSLARLLGRDLTRHGVSLVNVGSRGLRRFARIFQRESSTEGKSLPSIPIRVACLADRDILPDCAKEIFKLSVVDEQQEERSLLKFESDFSDEESRRSWIQEKCNDDSENVRTFVSDHWTLEYDLARAGLGKFLWQAIALAKQETKHDAIGEKVTSERPEEILCKATESYEELKKQNDDSPEHQNQLSCETYKPLRNKVVSKPMTAQHLATLLEEQFGQMVAEEALGEIQRCLPTYIRDAINFATNATSACQGGNLNEPAQGGELPS